MLNIFKVLIDFFTFNDLNHLHNPKIKIIQLEQEL